MRSTKKTKGVDTQNNSRPSIKSAAEAARVAQERNAHKIPVKLNARTTIYVAPDQVDYYEKKVRLETARDPKNKEKVEFLTDKGWILRSDGLWVNKWQFLTKDFKAALQITGYYEKLNTNPLL